MSSPADSVTGEGFDADAVVARFLQQSPPAEHYCLGFSGGLDSSVLLHLLARTRDSLPGPLSAIHVDHSLHPASMQWADHCRAQCRQLDVPITVAKINATPARGHSPEAAARTARYAAIARLLGPRCMLLTAHHLEDQAETLLLQLLRGSGVEGLAAMPAVRQWQGGWHARPLLDIGRAELRRWAEAHRLDWIDDPSNALTTADRNFLRHRVLPVLKERWPSAAASLAHSAGLCAEAADAVRSQAAHDCASASTGDGECLSVSVLCGLGEIRARGVLRYWLNRRAAPPLPSRRLREAVDQFCHARADAQVKITWDGVALHRFDGRVWLTVGEPAPLPKAPVDWTGEMLELGPGLGQLQRVGGPGGIDRRRWEQGRVQIGFRRVGLGCRPAGRQGTRSFKKLVHEYRIPPWQRDRLPILFIDGEIAAITNCCVCEPFVAPAGETGWHLRWLPEAGRARH